MTVRMFAFVAKFN